MESVQVMSKDLLKAATILSDDEARFLVDYYYITQEDRKRAGNQVRALDKAEEPHLVLSWLFEQSDTLEAQVKRAIEKYTDNHPMGSWMKQHYGIGPIISGGLLAHIDIERCPTVGHIWRYAGLDPTVTWVNKEKAEAWVEANGLDVEKAALHFGRQPISLRRLATTSPKGAKIRLSKESLAKAIARRPWNAGLKTLCWKVGQSFMKFSGKDECFYGKIYLERKAYEVARNESGENSEYAKERATKYGKSTDAYSYLSRGFLPPAQIDARARRYAVKLFLSHLHEEWYRTHFGKEPPLPYPIAFLGHAHKIDSPVDRAPPEALAA
jgi:hypothetical protein